MALVLFDQFDPGADVLHDPDVSDFYAVLERMRAAVYSRRAAVRSTFGSHRVRQRVLLGNA